MEDVLALGELPEDAFSAVAFATVKCDRYGYTCLEGNHRYAVDPAFAKRAVIVGKRAYGKAPSSSDDPLSQLNVLRMKPTGWQNSQVRHSLPEDLRCIVDKMERSERGDVLRRLRDIAQDGGHDAAVEAMGSCVRLLGEIDGLSVEAMAACAASDSRPVSCDDPGRPRCLRCCVREGRRDAWPAQPTCAIASRKVPGRYTSPPIPSPASPR